MVIRRLGFNSPGKAAGASAAGTSEIESSPVKSDPSGFLAEWGVTSRMTPIFGFVTMVVTVGSIVVGVGTLIPF